MKQGFIAVVFMVVSNVIEAKCNHWNLSTIAHTTHDPTIRKQLTLEWLKQNGSKCDKDELTWIYNNTASWLGTADNEVFRGMLIDFYMKKEK